MSNKMKQYETLVNNASEISQAMLDMEGGRYLLAVFSELIHEMQGEGDVSGAKAVMRKLHECVDVPFPDWPAEDTCVWLELFVGEIENALEESAV